MLTMIYRTGSTQKRETFFNNLRGNKNVFISFDTVIYETQKLPLTSDILRIFWNNLIASKFTSATVMYTLRFSIFSNR